MLFRYSNRSRIIANMLKAATFNVDENACIQNLLELVSHGNAIIAEILRLKDNVPPVFSLDTKEEQTKYGDVVFDFSYFKNSDVLEKKIANSPVLQELDDEFKETNLPIITRFYLAFENIYQYLADLNLFLEQLSEGVFIQQTLDTILQDNEGKQLLCESLYLYGVMLLVCETYVSGRVRERLLVAWHRATASHLQTNLDRVCKLLSDTGYRCTPGIRRPSQYPEELFRRVPIDDSFVEIIINRLRSEDIYNQASIFPLPEHRSTALAPQAAMLVVCLFFSPNTLMSESAKMREVVDKYFPDNWIVSIYMGITLNLIEAWEPYKAAKSAMANTINTKNIKDLAQVHSAQMKKIIPQTAKLLQEGVLKEEKLSDNINKILSLIRECNVTLRWLMLHTNPTVIQYDNVKKSKQVRDQTIAESKYKAMELYQLLINTSLLELCIKDMLKKLLNNKELKWEEQKKDAKERIIELAEGFSAEKLLPRVQKNENLQKWFNAIARQIDSLKHDDMAASSKKIIQLIQALEDVQEFHQLDDIMQVKQWLMEAREGLRNMVRGGGLTEDSLVTLQVCADLSYGWCVAQSFTVLGRDALKRDPALVSHLRAVFLKLASALEIPLLRINQAASPDLLSVSEYYSNELVAYVREVLQIIPETVFSLLERIIALQTSVIKELPSRVEKDQLKEFAQLEERMEVAKLTHSVSVFTSGILKMRSTLVGVICIDPKQLLEDGIRREVSRLVGARLGAALTGAPGGDLATRLQQLAKHMDGYRRSFEYIQDYINIHGLKIWQEEVSNIINASVEEECGKLLKLKAVQNSNNLNTTYNKNMFGCLMQDIYNLADPKTTVYIEHNSAWFDCKTHQETMTTSVIASVQRGVGVAGLHGIAKALGCRTSSRLRHLTLLLPSICHACPKPTFPPPNFLVPSPGKVYSQLAGKITKFMPPVLDWLLEIGTAQLLMKHIAYRLNTSCKFDSYHLEAALNAVNEAMLNDVRTNYMDPSKPYPHKDFLFELNELMERAGISQPYMNIYIKTSNDHIAYLTFLIVISHLKRLAYYDNLGCLTSRRSNDQLDGAPFIVGVATLLRQHSSNSIKQFVLLLSQYTMSYAELGLSLKTPELSAETSVALRFLELFCRVTGTPQSFMEAVIPANFLTQHQFMNTKTV